VHTNQVGVNLNISLLFNVLEFQFLKALQSLPIPNKTMLLDSKILSLIETWSQAPATTEVTVQILLPPTEECKPPQELIKSEQSEGGKGDVEIKPEPGSSTSDVCEIEKDSDAMDVDIPEPTTAPENTENVPKYTTTVSEIVWKFVEISRSLIESWADLKEVFRIPKKERVEQMKEHEREADKASALNEDGNFMSSSYTSSYDRDSRPKWITSRTTNRDRRSTIDAFNRQAGMSTRMMMFPNMSKEERRSMFAAKVAQEEEDLKQRKMQEEIVTLHQNRCKILGLDPCTTPVVDVSGHYYLDPKTIEWRLIDPQGIVT
jgi:histone-lysine N-methyltransferase SETD2